MKDLGYYMSLLYDIKAKELPKDAGGGVFLSIPLLGEATVNAYGDTYEEARALLSRYQGSVCAGNACLTAAASTAG